MVHWRSETRGHYAEHRIRVSTHLQRIAHCMWVAAKVVLPEMIAYYGKTRPALHIFPRRNDPAQYRLHAQRFEKTGIDESDTDLHRFGCAYVVHLLDIDSAPLRESARLSLDIHHVRERIIFLYDDELLRILVGKRTEQHSVDYTEYRSVRADAESERESGNEGEPGGFAQRPDRIAKVLSEVLNPSHMSRIATFFFAFFYSADFKESLPARF